MKNFKGRLKSRPLMTGISKDRAQNLQRLIILLHDFVLRAFLLDPLGIKPPQTMVQALS